MNESPFDKLRDASTSGNSCTLTHADVELLLDTLGDAFDAAEGEYEKWCERLDDYKRSLEREAGKSV